jgi:hypothetical protein
MPALLFPAALAALLALVIPLIVHLARRNEARPTDFAALEWLREKPRPKSRLRFDEWPLLALRLLLIAGIVIWLARPVLPGSTDVTPVVAAVPGVDAGAPAKGVRNIWLAPGFPSYDQPQTSCLPAPPAVASCPALASLIRQLDADLAPGVRVTLIVPEILSGLDAERPRLSRPVTWKIVPGAMPALATSPASISFTLPAGPDAALRYLRAAAVALKAPATPATTPIVVHLAAGPLPDALRAAIANGATVLAGHRVTAPESINPVWHDADGLPLATMQRIGRGRLYRFTRPLTPAAMPILLDPDFPRQLAAMLAPPPAPTRAMARDMSPTTGAAPWPVPARDMQPWLAFVIAALFLAERWLATRRSRAVAP